MSSIQIKLQQNFIHPSLLVSILKVTVFQYLNCLHMSKIITTWVKRSVNVLQIYCTSLNYFSPAPNTIPPHKTAALPPKKDSPLLQPYHPKQQPLPPPSPLKTAAPVPKPNPPPPPKKKQQQTDRWEKDVVRTLKQIWQSVTIFGVWWIIRRETWIKGSN